MKNALFWFLQIVALAILAVSLVTGALSMWDNFDADDRSTFLDQFGDHPVSSTFKSGVFLLSYQFVTPAKFTERIGDPEKKTWFIEDFPFPDSRDVIPLYFFGQILILLSVGISKMDVSMMNKILSIFLLFVIGLILFWFLFKAAAYYLMYETGADLGFTDEKILETRMADSQRQIDIYGVRDMLLLTSMFAVLILIGLVKGGKDD